MKKYLKSFKQSANFSSVGAMESGNHFKNGASPKSLTSRENLNYLILYSMKRFTLILAVTMGLMLTSCSKDSDDKVVNLAGTIWVEQSLGEGALSFLDKSNCRLVANGDEYSAGTYSFSGTYSYTPPNITILLDPDPNLAVSVMSGTVSGNIMELSGRGERGEEFTITFEKR
jgi:hypothetical protein